MKLQNGIVVSAHRLASEAGAQVLRKGGNAFDAAVATSLMLGVVEPAFSGIGGGGFALLHSAEGDDLALDYREMAPLASSGSMFSEGSDANSVGPLAIATPGLLAGHGRLLEGRGTMKFRDLAGPAIEVARSGFTDPSVSRDLLQNDPEVSVKINRFMDFREAYLGRTSFPALSKALSAVAEAGPDSFYDGPIHSDVSARVKEIGGILSEEDFARYAPKQRRPLKGSYRGYEVISMPPPSAGGALLIHGLGVIEETPNPFGREDAARADFMATLLEHMLKEREQFGDPDFTETPAERLVSRGPIRAAAREIGARRGRHLGSAAAPGSTTHYCIIDRKGNVVSATETVECYYGSGVVVPRHGILLNDEMHDFDARPGRPNSVAPLKRPASSMSPTILLKHGEPFLVLGASGATRIISSILQVITNVVDRKMSLTSALGNPRLHPQQDGLMMESGVGEQEVQRLRELGWNPVVGARSKLFYGGVQAAVVGTGGSVTGAADPRRRGVAVIAS